MSIAVFIKDQEGASAVEYVVLIALISTVIISAVAFLGKNTSEAFNNVSFAPSTETLSTEKQEKCKDSPDDHDCGIGND